MSAFALPLMKSQKACKATGAEHLFALKQALDMFDFLGTQLVESDHKIEGQLQSLQVHDGEPAKGKKRGRPRMRRSLICARNCSGCAELILRASTSPPHLR
ncbi:hypothetical protein NTGBS_40015 [Candidatus Nitrotoga sp. BS]|nr:hypothetical protein NTGBS_40015 [Candidatus Nitrotoga sp. BS]